MEWPIPPQRTRVLIAVGFFSRCAKTFSATGRMAETQRTRTSAASDGGKVEGIWLKARKSARMLMSLGSMDDDDLMTLEFCLIIDQRVGLWLR